MADVFLHSERLVLRDFVLADEPALHAFASDPTVTRYTTWGPNTPEETHAFLAHVLSEATRPVRDCYSLAAVERETERLVGSVQIEVESHEHLRGELGFVFASASWGRGYATEATRRLMRFGFDRLDLQRIIGTCHPDNLASARVLEKAGLSRECLMRGHLLLRDGTRRDSLLYAALRTDPAVS